MKIVVDINIVFSGLLNIESRIFRILLNPNHVFTFYSSEQLFFELHLHRDKLLNITGYSSSELEYLEMIITRHINIVPFEIIPKAHFENAYQLAKDIDQDGTEFIALADFLNAKLWTGDKKLISGLINKGWDSGISTEEMIELY